LQDKNVVLGVTGSIACYKAVDLASKLTKAGAQVDVILTDSATEFLSPLTFSSITHRPVTTNLFDAGAELGINHVALARKADIVIIAPATANTMAKMAHGRADDALTTTVLATEAPILVCPAMDGHMYDNATTQENVETLSRRGIHVAGPAQGHLASGITGKGRMIEVTEIVGHIRLVLGLDGDLAGRTIVVSAGGTREAIDPVRYITNHSSGKMGYAIAEAARDRGASVTLVSTPTNLDSPVGVRRVDVGSARQMRDAVLAETARADALIMAAAVADWEPETVASQKVKKGDADTWSIDLKRTPDILAQVPGEGLVKVGFAAETQSAVENARAKIGPKGLDIIVANDISAEGSGFGSDTNEVVIIDRNGNTEEPGLMSKYDVGSRILDRVLELLS